MGNTGNRLSGLVRIITILLGGVLLHGCTPENTPSVLAISSDYTEPLHIETENALHIFRVEIADTPEKSQKGLMFRQSMPRDAGMLFPFETARVATMWMKNTSISLDMLFIDEQGRVVNIVRNTEPYSLQNIFSDGPVSAVLELNAGTARAYDIQGGDHVKHRVFGDNLAD